MLVAEMAVRAAKLPFDFYLFYLYITIVMFFAKMKKSKMENGRLTSWNRSVIIIAYTLGILALYTSLMNLVINIILYVYKTPGEHESLYDHIMI